MATTKKRINISLGKSEDDILSLLAKRDNVPKATKAVSLLRMAMELQEDIVLGEIARSRDTKDAKFISHEKVWA